jgi:hypothetical protein
VATTPISSTARDDRVTVAAIAVIAACVVTADHEALGHGSVCLALGGRIARLTSVYFQCTVRSDWIAAGGPAGNLLMGAAAWVLFVMAPARMMRVRLLLMLIGALSVFWEAGYLVYSMARNDGDWAFAASAAFGDPAWRWRLGGAALALLTPDQPSDLQRVHALLRTAWVAATVSASVAAAAYAPGRLDAIHQAFLEIGAGSWPLLILARRVRTGSRRTGAPLTRDAGWLVLAVVVFAAFVMTLGRGIS